MSEIKVGMKFKNENYLLKYLDLYNTNATKNNKKKEQLKNFLEWELTGKKSRGKTTKEIIITKILEYPIDKMDGQATGFNMWLKEYIFNALLQPMHYILYYILISSSLSLNIQNKISTNGI